MTPLPSGKFKVIEADPAWVWATRSPKGLEGRPQHYDRMSLDEIKAMPVADVSDKDCFLFIWTTSPHLKITFEVITAWGFKYSSVAFTWVKLNPNAPRLFFTVRDLHMGQGYTTRKNAEFCLLGRKGRPRRLRKDIHEIIIAPRRQHSRKPDEAHERIEQFAEGPYLELFARTRRPGWEAWGNQIDKFTEAA